ncbi:LuxR C-terminal-related transcriptional regulator, partial [Pseudactinotalea sp.]|uniref:helix-turn-helix transcriptional regulator n=1 Tax=Pseudactinotalea sp. TaxID=1926260 RepID=UPI003B3BC647
SNGLPDPGRGARTSTLQAPLTAPFAGIAHLLGHPERPATDAEAMTVLRRSLLPDAGDQPALLLVDGGHLLDRASAEVIAVLARRGEVLPVVTARPVAGSLSPWHELWRDDVLDRIDVPDLSPADAEAMLVSLLDGAVPPVTARVLWDETNGNAFHLRELVTDHRDAGTLQNHDGAWTLTGAPPLTPRLLGLVRRDLNGLSPEAMLTLRALSLLGPLRLSIVLDDAGHRPLEELLGRGLVRTISPREQSEVMLELPHRLLGQVVRHDTPAPVRREILERTVEPRSGPPLRPQTVLLVLAEGVAISAARVRSSVAEAAAHDRPHDVVAIVDAALAPTVSADLREIDTIALLLDRALAHQSLNRPDAAIGDLHVALPRLLSHARSEPEDDQVPGLVVGVTRLRAALAQDSDDGVDAALAAIADGTAWLATLAHRPDRPRRERELEVARLTLLGYAGRHTEAQSAAVRVLEDGHDAHLVLPLVCPTGLGLLQAGRFADAARLVTRYRPVAVANSDRRRESSSELAVVAFFAQLWSGEIADIDGPPSSALDTTPWAGAHLGRGLVAAANGAWSPARRDLRTANARANAGSDAASPFGLVAEALAAAACGEADAARALLAEADVPSCGRTATLTGETRLLRLDALLWLRDAAAPAAARELVGWARAQQLTRIELEALHRVLVLRRWQDLPTDVAAMTRIEEIRARVRSARAAALVQHAHALRQQDGDLVEIAERELNRRGLWLPPGRQALALTHREREIAALARARLTSRVIADRLGLSARTVDSHLANAFTKLGVTSREDLSHALT